MKLPIAAAAAVLCTCVLVPVPARAATLTVNAGGNLQSALNAANPGDTILLQAGATFTGNYYLPAKSGTSYITIRSSAADSALPAAGVRITPTYASLLPKLRGSSGGAALHTAAGATYWRIEFVEFEPDVTQGANLIELGSDQQTTLASVPQHLIIDRCYIHGDPTSGQRRGIALNSGDTQILNSYFSDFKAVNQDTQAIAGWNGPGPYVISNNYLEAAGENLLFGGSDPKIPDLVPSNITITQNHIAKPLAWETASWTVKNLVEFKNAENVTINGNVIENNWAAGQQGYSVLFTPRNQGGTAPWTVVKDVVFENNILRHVAAGFNVMGYDNLATSQQTENIRIVNNLIYDVSTAYGTSTHPAPGVFAMLGAAPKDITFDHNTVDNNGHLTVSLYAGTTPSGPAIYGFVLTNNLLRDNKYGIFGANSSEGTTSLNAYCPGWVVQANAIAAAETNLYPAGNSYPSLTTWLAQFTSPSAGNYQLVSGSTWDNAGTDGKALGVDINALNAAQNGSTSTSSTGSGTSSTPYSGTPVALPGTVQFENFDEGGEAVAYHDTTAGNTGGAYRSTDVDITSTSDSGGGYIVGWATAGEWLNYTANVTTAGTYSIDIRTASNGSAGTFHITVDGTNVTGSLSVPNTGGWQTFRTITKTGVTLAAGQHIVRVVMDTNGGTGAVGNFNWFKVY